MLLQPINNIAEICARKGVQQVVISPGSRSAALTLAFARHPNIKTKVIPDERAAGFVGLGMAQYSQQTVALICTSGSAAYNFAPAVVEAYFQEIPLLIFTADRPKEWAGQQDGQTIYQNEIYGKHVKKSFELPADYHHPDAIWQIERVLNEAINLSQTLPKGPVHVNVPIREPFYPAANETIEYDRNVKIVERLATETTLSVETWHRLQNEFEGYDRVLIAVGQLPPNPELTKILRTLSEEFGVVVLGDVTANLPPNAPFIGHHDVVLGNKNEALFDALRPDLLITLGNSFISKNLKSFLRKHKPLAHWQVKTTPELVDSLQSLTVQIPVEPTYFFKKLLEDLDYQQFVQNDDDDETRQQYRQTWLNANGKAQQTLRHFLRTNAQWGDFLAVEWLLDNMPENAVLQLSNSMPVRYANLLGLSQTAEVFANRGTSGIDGCSSTAVGAAMMTDKTVFLLTGDVAFFYDRNAFWHPHLPENLRIVLINNGGGNIFRLIDGPSAQPELAQYFETQHQQNAHRTAEDAGMGYAEVRQIADFETHWKGFCERDGKAKILEIFTNPVVNGLVFEAYRVAVTSMG